MKNFFKIIVSIIITLYVAWTAFEYYWYSGVIPEKIGITYPINISGQSGLREGCGVAIFRLSNATSDAIYRNGIDFFKEVIYARKSQDYYYTYSAWEETPVPHSWVSEGAWPSLGCSSVSHSLLRKIVMAASEKGSYYSSKPEAKILVIPSLKLVVFSYFG